MNTPTIETERLILRRFTAEDAQAYFELMRDEEVNAYLPLFLLTTIEQAREHLKARYLETYSEAIGFRWAVCLKEDGVPIGYVCAGEPDGYDFGYALARAHWGRGIMTEACTAAIEALRRAGLPYITATHDRNNPRSGAVMRRVGMCYCYSYREQWMPKDFSVVFRMYQMNLCDQAAEVYSGYKEMYPEHFVEAVDG